MSVQLAVRVSRRCVRAGVTGAAVRGAQPAETSIPRTADGRPDLQGVWDFSSVTPLQRPAEDGRPGVPDRRGRGRARGAGRGPGRHGAAGRQPRQLNRFWFADGTTVSGTRRTSLITDPPNGRLPSYTDTGRARMALREEARNRNAGPEDRDVDERCILGFNSGPPMLPGAYNNFVQVFQGPEHVVILNEMVNDSRIVPLDGRPTLPAQIQQWRGDSRGRWEGDTLVIETTNFKDIGTAHPAPNMQLLEALGPHMHLEERISRLDADTLLYRFTVTDPTAFTASWSAELTMTRAAGRLYEYACHEGNYGLYNILAGAQAEYRAAAQR